MAGNWPSSLFACLRTETESRSKSAQKRGQYLGILARQAWSIKDLCHGKRTLFSCGILRVIPSGQGSVILPARVANHSAGFGSSDLYKYCYSNVYAIYAESVYNNA